MRDSIQAFYFEWREVRVIERDGEPWFVAADVCEILGLANPTEALRVLDDDEKNTLRISEGIRGNPNMNIISESGLYTLIMRSNKPEARAFRKWVTGTVIPSIRKHSAYLTPRTIEEALSNPDFIIGLAQKLKDEQARNAALTQRAQALEAQAEADRPKVVFADSVEVSKNSILIGDLAKLLRQNGVKIGRNRLFEWLRENGLLIRQMGESYNMPTQVSMERGIMEIKERTVNNPDGSIRITKTPKVTGKGQIYLTNLLLNTTKH